MRRRVGDREVYRFRVASNARRRTADGVWETGDSLFVSVSCWTPRLVAGVGAALSRGSAVIVVGTIATDEYDDRDGNRRTSVEVRATAVGPDLSRCIAHVEPPRTGGGNGPETPVSAMVESTVATAGDGSADPVEGRAGEDRLLGVGPAVPA